jgi:hypothetical protein
MALNVHVLPPSSVCVTAPRAPLAHATCELTTLKPRNEDVLRLARMVHCADAECWGAANATAVLASKTSARREGRGVERVKIIVGCGKMDRRNLASAIRSRHGDVAIFQNAFTSSYTISGHR